MYGICRSFKAFNLPALGTCLDFNLKSTQVEIAVPATFQAHQEPFIRAWNKSHVAIQLELQLFFLPKEPQAELLRHGEAAKNIELLFLEWLHRNSTIYHLVI